MSDEFEAYWALQAPDWHYDKDNARRAFEAGRLSLDTHARLTDENAARLAASNRELRAERDAAIRRATEMHRRAQRLESMEARVAECDAKVARIQEAGRAEVRRVRERRVFVRQLWRQRYNAAVDQLIAAGVPDHHEHLKTRHLDVLISRALEARDAATRRAEEAERMTELLRAEFNTGLVCSRRR